MIENQVKDLKITVIELVEEEEYGADMVEDKPEITKRKRSSTGQEEEMRMNKDGTKRREVEVQEQEVEGEEEESEDNAEDEKTAGRRTH